MIHLKITYGMDEKKIMIWILYISAAIFLMHILLDFQGNCIRDERLRLIERRLERVEIRECDEM